MCINCWIQAGRPMIRNEAVETCAAMIDGYCDRVPGGGYAHIVVEDWNLEDGNIDCCLKAANGDDEEGVIDVLLALRALSEDERYSAMAIADGFDKDGTDYGDETEATL